MKTAVIMQREFNGLPIRQNSKNGFLNVNDLLACYLTENPSSNKQVEHYLKLKQIKEFAEAIREAELESIPQNANKNGDLILPLLEPLRVLDTKRGKNGGTWVHPYMFLDFAMWLNPRFKVWAMSIIEDKLIALRNEAGDRFKEMNQALKLSGGVSPRDYSREATMINKIVFNGATKEQRDKANERQLDLLNKLQRLNAHLIKQGISFYLREKECQNFVKVYNVIN